MDQDYYSVYVAKNCIAREAQYICADADISLPLADASCGLTLCGDASFLFLHQASCMRELKRVTSDDGIIVLSAVRNGLVKKDHYVSILPSVSPEGFRALAGDMPHRIVSNEDIMARFRNKQGPTLASQTPLPELSPIQWLSLIASYRADVFRDYPAFKRWPHLEGCRLGINPAYKEQRKDRDGSVVLQRCFPTAWYEQENASPDGQFTPESALITARGMLDIADGNQTPGIERLIAQSVVLGFP